MGVSPDEAPAGTAGTLDLATFNVWLCNTRLRAVGAVTGFALGLHAFGIGRITLGPLLGVCAGLLVVSAVGRIAGAAPRLFFHAQNLADLVGITLGIHWAVDGQAALLFRPIYALVVVPASLISVPSGLAVAAAATAGHEVLLGLERGFSFTTVASLESLVPAFAFFLVAQQCFFYGAHLERKNTVLAGLAARLEGSRQQLASAHDMHAGLVEVARTLNSTLEASELLARVNRTTRAQLGADWSATFLVDPARATFRLAAVTDADSDADELGAVEFPLRGWPAAARLATEPVVLLTGEEAGRLPGLFSSPRCLSTVFVAGLRREQALVGFLAVGYHTIAPAGRERALDLLGRIAQHATIALGNARLLEDVPPASTLALPGARRPRRLTRRRRGGSAAGVAGQGSLRMSVLALALPALVAAVAGGAGFPPAVAEALRSAKHIYVATVRADGSQSAVVPVWFMVEGDAVYFTSAPDSHKVRRIRRGSPLRVWVGSRDGPHFTAHAEVITDPAVAARMAPAYDEKYWISWLGFFRPRPERVRDGKTVLIKVTPEAG
jgi:general stress protein 26